MKHVVISDRFSEGEIRPQELFDRYVALSEKECRERFKDPSILKDVRCPGCRSSHSLHAFGRFGLDYKECRKCRSLFVSPRPGPTELLAYDQESAAMSFLRKELMSVTTSSRMEHIIDPRIDWLLDMVRDKFDHGGTYVDLATRYVAVLQQVGALPLFDRRISINPDKTLRDVCQASNFLVIERSFEEIKEGEGARVVTAFETLNRCFDPEPLVSAVYRVLERKGLFLITALSSSGFDVQVLWDKAKNILPIDQLNIYSVEGLTLLLERNGFRVIELSTPGQLDVEMTRRSWEQGRLEKLPRFLEYLFRNRSEQDLEAFQKFLQEARLSSHLRVAAEKV